MCRCILGVWLFLQRFTVKYFSRLTGQNIVVLSGIYISLSWLLLFVSGEHQLSDSFSTFFYYIVVTASTVGYGDHSPESTLGKWVAALFIIPGGLGLFAIVVGRVATVFVTVWRKGLLGKRSIKMEQHILLLGWNGNRTLSMLRMLLHEEHGRRSIVLCSRSEIENPMPDKIEFVRVSSYTNVEEMARANINKASCIIVDALHDDVTLTAALFAAGQNPNAHLLAYFDDEGLSQLLKLHCPNAECIPSVAIEMLAKSAVDPGSSLLHQELLSTDKGMTQYAIDYPYTQQQTTFSALFEHFKHRHDAILIACDSGHGIQVNPPLSLPISPDTRLFYIADERVNNMTWPEV